MALVAELAAVPNPLKALDSEIPPGCSDFTLELAGLVLGTRFIAHLNCLCSSVFVIPVVHHGSITKTIPVMEILMGGILISNQKYS